MNRRTLLAEKLADLGNIAVGSLVFGVVMRAEAFNQVTLTLGLLIVVLSYVFSIAILKK